MANVNDFYAANVLHNGVFNGRTLIQAGISFGGSRHVFVKLGGQEGGVVYPTIGCQIMNPFKGAAKAFAGDLIEFRTKANGDGGEGYILKTYLVAEDAAATATEIKIVRDGYKHIPFVGDVLMIGQAKFTTKAKGVTVTAVEQSEDGSYWTVTLAEALGAVKKDAVLVEAAEAGASVLPMVTNPNAYFPGDADFIYNPNVGKSKFEKARYFYTPALSMGQAFMYIHRMSPLPPAVEAINQSKVNGWFLF